MRMSSAKTEQQKAVIHRNLKIKEDKENEMAASVAATLILK